MRLDTFPAEARQQVFYIGNNQTEALREMHRDIYNIAERYGKNTFLMIDRQDAAPFQH